MGDHWGGHSLKTRYLLIPIVIGLFFFSNGLRIPSFSNLQKQARVFSEVNVFFKGSDQEVEVYRCFGREPGATMLIFAGIHGDESGGYLTADRYVGLNLIKGNLIVVPRLNLYAILTGKRTGLSGRDMNRKFQPSDENQDLDDKIVSLAKSLMDQADIILNLHQGHGFYSPVWVDQSRNPIRWGQCNVIDVSTYDLPDGRRLYLEHFAKEVALKINAKIMDQRYHFHVNNTNTLSKKSIHQEQRKSLTYFALTYKHKMAFGIEATKNCSLPQAIGYLSLAINAMMEKAGIVADAFPSSSPEIITKEIMRNEEFLSLRININGQEAVVYPKSEIRLTPGDQLQILSVEAIHSRAWYPSFSSSNCYNGIGKVFSVTQNDQLIVRKYGKRVGIFYVSVGENTHFKNYKNLRQS